MNNEARGKFTIFLGAAAGVGKTYAMLSEAQAQLRSGVNVKVGFVETHGRYDTAAMIGDIPVIPKKKIEYHGAVFEEMDTDAIIDDHPQLVLIDELAHTNVPGSPRKQRYEDITVILDHGIDVWSTVNIQHLESLNVIVYELTGVKVRETFPDYILESADEIRLIDISAEALIERLKAGKVYPAGKIEASLANFFQKSNLAALRELSLREVANEVEEPVPEEAPRPIIQTRVMVCVGPETDAQRIIRRGWRLAKRFSTDLTVIHVKAEPGWFGSNLSEAADEAMRTDALRELCRVLGAQFVELDAGGAVAKVLQAARERRVGLLVLGRPRRTGVSRIVREPFLLQVLDRTNQIDIYVVNDEDAEVEQGERS